MKKKKRKSGSVITVILVLVLITGLSLLLYPTVSNYWNALHQTKAITEYNEAVAAMNEEDLRALWQSAEEYNQKLPEHANPYQLNEEEYRDYMGQLNINGNGVMGSIEIPAIDVKLPIYHGTSESVLNVAAGHLEWSSLPVGGAGSHCVLSGHRGLPSAKLFTHLDKLAEGDLFVLHVLDEVLTYEVDQILIVEPQNTEPLRIVEGEDLCTLVTCTPYGINTHRLLVRGHRVENSAAEDASRVSSDAVPMDPLLTSVFFAIPILLILGLVLLLKGKKPDKKRKLPHLKGRGGSSNE